MKGNEKGKIINIQDDKLVGFFPLNIFIVIVIMLLYSFFSSLAKEMPGNNRIWTGRGTNKTCERISFTLFSNLVIFSRPYQPSLSNFIYLSKSHRLPLNSIFSIYHPLWVFFYLKNTLYLKLISTPFFSCQIHLIVFLAPLKHLGVSEEGLWVFLVVLS